MLEANVAKIILELWRANTSLNASSTQDSLAENPGLKAFVLSLSNSLTPSLPNAAILWISAIGPIGVKSNLKSPVSKMIPFGVLITIAKLSGIECVVVTKDISKCLYLNTLSLSYTSRFL